MITNGKGLTLFAVKTHAGMCGTDAIEGVWAKDAAEACDLMAFWADDHWDAYTHDDDEYVEEERTGCWAEPWDDEVHPSEWPGGAKFAKDFE